MEQGDIVKAHCNRCSGERNHFILYVHEGEWTQDLPEDLDAGAIICGEDRYELLKCTGCGDVRLRCTYWVTEDESEFDEFDEADKPPPTIIYYPPALIRREPSWLSLLDDSLYVSRLLREVYTAVQNDCCSIAAMGIRALLERLMIEHVDDQESFSKNLAAFEKAGHVGHRDREIIETTLDFGHASIHRNYNPTREDTIRVLEIAENIIQRIYVSAKQAKALKERIPQRVRRAKKATD